MDKDVTDWDAYFMQFAELASTKSKDDKSKYGAAIIGPDNELLGTGFNGMPRGVNEHLDYRRRPPHKYAFIEHAERNAIYNAARSGVRISNCTMYLLALPCAACARAIIQSGITKLVTASDAIPKDPGREGSWRMTVGDGLDMLQEAGVIIRVLKG